MSSFKLCKCGSLASWNSYFGGYYCPNCGLILEDGLPDGGRGGQMNITSCPRCGGRVRSVSIGWKCEGCNGFIDMSGQFHEHKDEPFMPPMTNADRIRAMSDEELSEWLCQALDCDFCKAYLQNMSIYSCCENQVKGIFDWLQQPAKEDT